MDKKIVPWILALVPFACLVLLVARYRVDVLWMDEWSLVPLIERAYQGTLSLGDLFMQYGEQRPFFLRIILLPLIRLSGWNTFYELAFTLLLAAGIFAALSAQIVSTLKSLGVRRPFWFVPCVSLLVFSLRQQSIWLVGFYSVFLLNVFPAVLGICLLARPGLTPSRFFLAALCGLVAAFSLANGLLYWPIGLLLLRLPPFRAEKERGLYSRWWALLGSAGITIYLYSYHKPAGHPSIWFSVTHPFQCLRYLLGCLGSPILYMRYAWMGGLMGIVFFAAAIWALWRSRYVKFKTLLPYVALGMYSLGTAVLITMGRAGFGYSHAQAARYVPLSVPFWVSVLVLLYLVILESRVAAGERPHAENRIRSCGGGLAISAVLLLAALSSIRAVSFFPDWHKRVLPARHELFSMRDEDLLGRLYPKVEVLRPWVETIRRRHLSVFRE